MSMRHKSWLSCLAATAFVAIAALAPSAAVADEVTVAGSASGSFNGGGTSVAGLEYFGSTFNGTSAGGFIGFGEATGLTNNFGMFRLDSDAFNYFGNTFTLNLTFSAPLGIDGGQTAIYNALVQGVVTSNGNGGVNIDFDNTPLLFTFTDGVTEGSFTLAINDVALYPELDNTISGVVLDASQTAAIPEPGTMALVGAGLLPFAGLILRRRRTA